MPHVVDDMLDEAQLAIAAMRAAAVRARALHARAELMRHMRATAASLADRPLAEAAALVAGEWMKAWHLDDGAYTGIAADIRLFTEAFVRDAHGSTRATQQAILDTTAALDAALARHGTTLADQMAWRSQCAHGWWELVAPSPPDLPNRPDRPGVPRQRPGAAFWTAGCAAHCAPPAA
ncbi:MAG: hypothetical protein IT555_13065 [Acetobacteraceae bacterium]|nr:hypothetical protein [Acetobacteraceae bacterium]